MDKTELRLDPLTESWTLFSAARAQRPTHGSVRDEVGPDPFLASNERFTPRALQRIESGSGWQVRVVPNRAPVLRVEGNAARRADGVYEHMDGVGAHEVIIEDPGARTLEELPLADVEKVITAWKTRMLDLRRDGRMRSMSVIKAVGRAAGALVPHSVSQLVAMAIIPPLLRRKLEIARRFYEAKQRSIFEDILAEEVRVGSRLVYENNGFSAFCPYASRGPFELAIFPKRQCADFHGITDQECSQFADVLRTTLRKLNRALSDAPYQLALTTAPLRSARRDHWTTLDSDFRWHVEILPRLDPPSAVEFATGCAVNSVWPEPAAAHLRALDVSA